MKPPEQLGRNTESGEHLQLYAEQVRLLYKNAPLGLIATLINSAVLVFIMRTVVPHRVLIAWFVCILLVSIARFVQLFWFRRVLPETSDVVRSERGSMCNIGKRCSCHSIDCTARRNLKAQESDLPL